MEREVSEISRWALSAEELAAGLVEKVAELRRLEAEVLADVAELDSRGGALGYGSTEKLLTTVVRVGLGEARRMVRRATALHDTVSPSGTVIPAALPETAAAFAGGEISAEHVDAIAALHREVPDADPEAWRIAESHLANSARTVPPRGLNASITELRARLDPDGSLASEAELARPDRELRTGWIGDRYRIVGEFDREAGMLIEAALSPLSAPRTAEDHRPTEERRGDALVELVSLAMETERLPGEGGNAVTILLTMDERDLRDGISAATTMDGHRVPVSQVRRLACDAGIIPALLGRAGEVLDTGSRARTAPSSVRTRLILRDRGCAFPGCERPPSHTQAHHVRHWADGGATTPENMVLLCGQHHRAIHHSQWEVRMRDGTPEFLPPSYVDKHRWPRRQPARLAA